MQNWSGHLKWSPEKVFRPTTEGEIIEIVRQALSAKKKVRLIGSGHSFTPLCVTTDFLISLDDYQGLISIDAEQQQATVKAGTKLFLLNELLVPYELALENMGDINVQSIAGALSTGTHGTGISFGTMSTQIVALRFINGQGEIIACSRTENFEIFKAAQISLGCLGIITEITLQCVPAYHLELIIDSGDLGATIAKLPEYNQHRNFEFYWFPNTDRVMTKVSNLTTKPPSGNSFGNYIQEMVLENYAFKAICETSYRFPSLTHRLSRFSAKTISRTEKISASHQVFATPRLVRFNEMEYNIPMEAYPEVMKELTTWINKNNQDILFPLENRFVQQDDIYLSPAFQRNSAYIAAHVYSKKDHRPYFRALEDIFRAHAGRPHWGKWHTRTREELETLYPAYAKFLAIREAQDPDRIFLSPYLTTLFLN